MKVTKEMAQVAHNAWISGQYSWEQALQAALDSAKFIGRLVLPSEKEFHDAAELFKKKFAQEKQKTGEIIFTASIGGITATQVVYADRTTAIMHIPDDAFAALRKTLQDSENHKAAFLAEIGDAENEGEPY